MPTRPEWICRRQLRPFRQHLHLKSRDLRLVYPVAVSPRVLAPLPKRLPLSRCACMHVEAICTLGRERDGD